MSLRGRHLEKTLSAFLATFILCGPLAALCFIEGKSRLKWQVFMIREAYCKARVIGDLPLPPERVRARTARHLLWALRPVCAEAGNPKVTLEYRCASLQGWHDREERIADACAVAASL